MSSFRVGLVLSRTLRKPLYPSSFASLAALEKKASKPAGVLAHMHQLAEKGKMKRGYQSQGPDNVLAGAVLCGAVALTCCLSCRRTVLCKSNTTGLIWKCPHCHVTQIRPGSPETLPFIGEGQSCHNKECSEHHRVFCAWIWRFDAKRTDNWLRFGSAAVFMTGAMASFFCPPISEIAATATIGAAGTGGLYNLGMGAATLDWPRHVLGLVAFYGAALEVAGEAAAQAVRVGYDALEVVANITLALLEHDPVHGGIAVFSVIVVGMDGGAAREAVTRCRSAIDAENAFKHARQNMSNLVRSIRAGRPQPGVQLGTELICNLRMAGDTKKALKVLRDAKRITIAEHDMLHELYCMLTECCGFTGDIADFMDALNELAATVYVEKR